MVEEDNLTIVPPVTGHKNRDSNLVFPLKWKAHEHYHEKSIDFFSPGLLIETDKAFKRRRCVEDVLQTCLLQ